MTTTMHQPPNKRLSLEVLAVENGFIVIESGPLTRRPTGRMWVAHSVAALQTIIGEIAEEGESIDARTDG